MPPKDPYIQVRVLEDIGEVSLGDHSISLTKNSLHFLRRTDTEQFISQVCYLTFVIFSVCLFHLLIMFYQTYNRVLWKSFWSRDHIWCTIGITHYLTIYVHVS